MAARHPTLGRLALAMAVALALFAILCAAPLAAAQRRDAPRPQARPAPRPQARPQARPAPRPELPRPAPAPQRPQTRPSPSFEMPSTRPSPGSGGGPSTRPAPGGNGGGYDGPSTRPSPGFSGNGGGSAAVLPDNVQRPSFSTPSTRPAPSQPMTRPSPGGGGNGNGPSNKLPYAPPAKQPGGGPQTPSVKLPPGVATPQPARPSTRPSTPQKPTTKPAPAGPSDLPGRPTNKLPPGISEGVTTLPARPGNLRPQQPPSMTRPLPFTPEVSSKHWGGWTNDWGRWWGDCGSWGFGGCMNNLMPWGNWGCKPYWPGFGNFWFNGFFNFNSVWFGGCGGIFDWCWRGGYVSYLWPSLLYSWQSAWYQNAVPTYAVSVTNQIAEYGYPASYAYGNAIANAEQGSDNWRALTEATASIFCQSSSAADAWSSAIAVAVSVDQGNGCQLLADGYAAAASQCPGNNAQVLDGVDQTTVDVLTTCGILAPGAGAGRRRLQAALAADRALRV